MIKIGLTGSIGMGNPPPGKCLLTEAALCMMRMPLFIGFMLAGLRL